jgi:uncharacterized protein YcaQ
MELSQTAARALMLAALGLDRRPRRAARKADVLDTIRRLRVLQIDTIHVVARSPYLVLWSRLGDYDPQWLDELLAEGRLFEYWAHAACFVPIEDFPLWRRRMLDNSIRGWGNLQAWAQKHSAELERVRARIRESGPVRSADFERTDGQKGGWWNWKIEKAVLETLFTLGELMIVRRENFQRVYDLRERVLPGWDDARAWSAAAAYRALALEAVRALGVATTPWISDYFRTNRRDTAALVRALADEGALLRVPVAGWSDEAYVHPDNAKRLRAAAAGRLVPDHTTLLSPFDPLIWDRARALAVFGFDYRIECYTPAARRRYGYFTLAILRRGALVGRVDPKAHRQDGLFEVKALYLEPGVTVTDELVADVAGAIRECAQWHGTPEVVVRKTQPAKLRAALRRALDA